MRGPAILTSSALAATLSLAALVPAAAQTADPTCEPGGTPVAGRVEVTPDDAKTYQLQPFTVEPGTTRVDVHYEWGNASPVGDTPLTATTIDLGVWDADGYRSPDGFRGWSGSRHHDVTIAQDEATRSMYPGPIEPGTWWVEFGVAAVAPDGGWYAYEVTCDDPAVGPPPPYDPVDPDLVADPTPGWYHGDFHMHGYQSNPDAPPYDEFVAFARSQGLDFFPLTEYVTGVHWGQLGPYQRANPDVLFWPGREIITYVGHVTQFGATPGAIEYRHGFEDVTMAGIVDAAQAEGALLGVAHPTTFEQPGFESFCRGCAYELEDVVPWDEYTTFEVAQGPQVIRPDPAAPGFENPFTQTAIDLWEDLQDRGIFLTGVGASDDKLSGRGSGPTYTPHGVPATAVYARELSIDAVSEGVQAGHVYVRTRGVADSPAVEVEVVTPDGTTGMVGDRLAASEAEVTVTVTGGAGQLLRIIRDGTIADVRPITADPFTATLTATRDDDPTSPLGTRYRFETADAEGRTTIGNPFFLTASAGAPSPDDSPPAPQPTGPPATPTLPTTGGGLVWAGLLALALTLLVAGRRPETASALRRDRSRAR